MLFNEDLFTTPENFLSITVLIELLSLIINYELFETKYYNYNIISNSRLPPINYGQYYI